MAVLYDPAACRYVDSIRIR